MPSLKLAFEVLRAEMMSIKLREETLAKQKAEKAATASDSDDSDSSSEDSDSKKGSDSEESNESDDAVIDVRTIIVPWHLPNARAFFRMEDDPSYPIDGIWKLPRSHPAWESISDAEWDSLQGQFCISFCISI